MVTWDLACVWRRSLISLTRGLCACLLVALHLFVNLVLLSGHRTARTAPPSHLQASLGKESYGSSPASVAEAGSLGSSGTPHVGSHTPLTTHCHPRFVGGQPLALNAQEGACSLILPKIVVQDFSAEDGLVRDKTPEYDLTHTLKRRRRPSRARISMSLGGNLAVTT